MLYLPYKGAVVQYNKNIIIKSIDLLDIKMVLG